MRQARRLGGIGVSQNSWGILPIANMDMASDTQCMSETPQSTSAVKDLVWQDAAVFDTAPTDDWASWTVDTSASLDLGDRTVRARITPPINIRLLATIVAVWIVVFAATTVTFAELTGLPSGHGEVAVLLASGASAAALWNLAGLRSTSG